MLHHVSVGVADVGRAAVFYDAVLGALGFRRVMEYMPVAIGYGTGAPTFWVQLPHNQQPASVGNGVHIGFSAKSKAAVHKFHQAALAAGGRDDGAPGPREIYGPDYYGAFVIDLDGNKLEATLHEEPATAKAAPAPRRKAKRKRPVRRTARSRKRPARKRRARRK